MMLLRSVVAVVVAAVCAAAHAQTLVGGIIDEDETWDLARSPFLVSTNATVEQGATLTIEPGVEVLFREGVGLRVGIDGLNPDRTGTLIADGTAAQPIVFGLAIPGSALWTGVQFGRDAEDGIASTDGRYVRGSIIRHALISDAVDAIDAIEAAPFLEALDFSGPGDVISIVRPDPLRVIWIRGLNVQGGGVGVNVQSAIDVRIIDADFVDTDFPIRVSMDQDDDTLLLIDNVSTHGAQIAVDVDRVDALTLLDSRFEVSGSIAVDLLGDSGVIRRCEFIGNNASRTSLRGGGMGIIGGIGWLVEDCLFERNQAGSTSQADGAGLYFAGENITLRRCTFIENVSERSGGGASLRIEASDHDCVVEDCDFIDNQAVSGSGGGLLVNAIRSSQETVLVLRCRFEGNSGQLAGGLTVGSRNARITDNDFIANVGQDSAGALRMLNDVDNASIRANRFVRNRTGAAGGAIDLVQTSFTGDLLIESNTFDGNEADLGGAVGNIPRGSLRFIGNEFKQNVARLGGAIHVRPSGIASLAIDGDDSNCFLGNVADLGSTIYNGSAEDIDATRVCWGTEDLAEIAGMIYDNADDATRGVVLIDPIATDCTAPCRADLDGDGELSIFDFLAFLNLFQDADPAADFDGDGELTIFDFLAFQNEFDAGCD